MTPGFRALLLEGLRKFGEGGYVSSNDLDDWLARLYTAIEREVPTDDAARYLLKRVLDGVYKREVRGGLADRIEGLERYTIDRVSPQLRAELDRRIFAGVDLIRLNRKAAVEKTLQRFAGWVSSVPAVGTTQTNLRAAASEIAKPIVQLKYEARRVAIDQGHKLSAAVAHVVAQGNGAIGAIWHDRGEHDHGYDARPEHLKRSGKTFLIRDSWAMQEGLVRKSLGVQYTDEIEQVSELPYCGCYYEYITTPQNLPYELLTGRGRAWVSGKPVEEYRADAATPAQRAAGNYRKNHIRFQGLDISLETRAGQERTGIGTDGREWRVVMPADYGYIRRTLGADDEHIDCYIGPNAEAERVWIIQQHDPQTHRFDEQKVMLGFNSRDLALETYRRGFSDGQGQLRIGGVLELSLAQFRSQIAQGRTLLYAVGT